MAGTDHWRQAVLGEVIELKRGYDLPQHERAPGSIPRRKGDEAQDHQAWG